VTGICDIRQMKIYTAQTLISEPTPFDVEINVAKLKRYKSEASILSSILIPYVDWGSLVWVPA
jgi:hypothetical protein